MLKTSFLPVLFMAALMASSSIGIVSCSDDYDDTAVITDITDLTDVTTDLTGVTTDLQTKLATLQTIQSSLPTMDQLNEVAAEAKTNADDDKAEAIAEAHEADAAMLTGINTKIDEAKIVLTEAIDSKVNSEEVDAAITAALNELNISDLRTLFAGINNADLVAMNSFVDNWNSTTRPAIIAQITSLGVEVKAMMTQLDVEKTNVVWYWNKIVVNTPFLTITPATGQEFNELESINLIANVNPSNVDMTLYDYSIRNSSKTELPVVTLLTPATYTGFLTKAVTSNNMWQILTSLDETSCSASTLYNNRIMSGDNQVALALVATNKTSGRQITSPYDITINRTQVTPYAAAELTVSVIPLANVRINKTATFKLMKSFIYIINSSRPVYKKYITTTEPAASFPGVNTLLNYNTDITLQCNDSFYINKTITFTVHYLNFDGTTGSATTDVTFIS